LSVAGTAQVIAFQIKTINGFPQHIDHSPDTDFIFDAFAGQSEIHRFPKVFLVMGLVFTLDALELVLSPLTEFTVLGS
jgi:hypothetical protein